MFANIHALGDHIHNPTPLVDHLHASKITNGPNMSFSSIRAKQTVTPPPLSPSSLLADPSSSPNTKGATPSPTHMKHSRGDLPFLPCCSWPPLLSPTSLPLPPLH